MALNQRLERAVKDMCDSFFTIIKSSQVSTSENENQSQVFAPLLFKSAPRYCRCSKQHCRGSS